MKKLFKFLVAVFMGLALTSCGNIVIQPILNSVELNKETVTLEVGQTETLEATISPENLANGTTITWSTTNDKVATVNDKGVVTAVEAGTAKIKVTATRGSVRREDTCTVKVLPKVILVTGITLDKNEGRLNVGESIKLTPTVLPDNATNKSVTWSTSDANVATVNDGLVSAIKAGNVTITVTTNDGNKNATCTITVIQPVSGVVLDKQAHTLNVGENFTLTATVNPNDAENKEVTWSSSNAAVATVNNGKVTALKAGTTTITVKTTDGNKEASCVVTVLQPVTGIELDAEELALVVGEDTTLVATVLPSDASNKAVTWTSNNTAVATVNAEGKVIAVGPGSAVITATTVDGNKTSTCTVTVVEFELPATGVVIEGDKNTLVIEETLLLEAVVTPEETTDVAIWSSSNENVATVDRGGLVTALAAGTTTIKVKYGAVEATYDITVNKNTVVVSGFEDKVVTYGSNYEFIYTVSSNQTVSLEYYKGETKLAAKPTNAGEYNVKLTLAENDKYNAFTKTVKLTINQKEVSEPTVSGSYTYNGSEQTVTLVGLESYMSVAGNKATNAGSYEVVVTLDNNHKWAQGNDGVVAWSIAKANASLSVEDLEVELGAEIKVNYETSSNGQVTIKFYQNNVEVTPDATGEYKVVVSVAEGDNHKAVEAEATLTIVLSATSVELSKDSTTINVGENETIEIKVNPVGTTDEVVITSSNEAVATMDKNGKIVAKTTTGTTTITVTCGDYSDSIVVTVVSPWGTKEEPISVEKALELTNALNSWGYSKVPGYMIGVVVEPGYSSQYKNYTMIVADLNNPAITYTFFRGVDTDPSNESIVSVGDIVVLYGYYCNYGSTNPTPEMTKYNNVTPTIISVEKPKFDIELSVKDTNGNDTTSVTVVDLEEKAEVNSKVEFTIENEQNYILIVTVNDVELTPVDGTYSFIITEATSVKVIVVEGNVNADSITIEGETTVELDDTLTLVGTTVPYYATETKTWTSSDETIATVVNGVVTPKKAGTVTITVKTGTTNKEATHEITITNRWGTLENPISVETAISLIDTLSPGTCSIKGYVTGVVSSKPEPNSRGNYIFEIVNVDTLTSTKVFKVYSGVSATAPNIGDVVVVSGYFKFYSPDYEITYNGNNDCVIESISNKEYSYTVEYLDTEDAVFEGAEVVGLDDKLTSGDESVFTVNVPQGYEVNKVKFNDVTITPNSEGEYTIVTALENVITVIVIEEGAEVPEPTTTTVTTKIADYAAANNWVNDKAFNTVVMDENITITAEPTKGSYNNTGKYYTNGNNWRMYQNENPEIIISAKEGNIVSVKITYANKNNGSLTLNNKNIASNTVVEVNDSSVQFSVGNTGTATNGNIQITNIEVVYSLSEVSTPTCEHTNTTTTTVEATCTQKGSTTVTCVDCSEVISTTEIPMIDHADVNTDDDHDCDACGAKNVTEHVYVEGVCNCGDEQGTDEPELVTKTVTTKIADYAAANNWVNEKAFNTVVMDENITITAKPTKGSYNNTGKYYTNGNNWRMYQNENPEIIISAKEGNIVSVKITYANKNNGSLTLNNKNIASNTVVEINDSSVQFSVGNTGTVTNGNIQITNIEVVYSLSEVSTPTCEHTNTTTTTVEATCTQKGSTTVTCDACGEVISTTEIPMIDHADVNTDDNHNCDACGAENVTKHVYVEGVCNCGAEETSEPSEPVVVLEITKEDFNATSYAANNNTKTENGYSYTSNQVMNYQSNVMQWQKNNGYITIDLNQFEKLEMKVSAGTFTVTVGGKTVTGTTANGVTTYNLSGLTGQIKISVGGAAGKVDYIKFYK